MAETIGPRRQPRQLTELSNVHDFLEEVRLRPGMWVHRKSLQHLDSMLVGYRVALGVHGVAEDFDFWNPGTGSPFAEWLCRRLGRHSSLGWAAQIEREAEAAGVPAIELFFSFFDEYRADTNPADGPVE
ncbi:hypothetical protein [Streptomyces sp. RO-S4]|uniref:hypothetical protein n=1 Tax=Streptomyces sp. RO-S4 TaxID=2902486 RepID=UPI00208EF52B|nr:hypothetical protein [Streptomyces sp. RO-S4]